MKLVRIDWVDSHAGRGWQDIRKIQDAAKPLPCSSVGWLVKRNSEVYILAAHFTLDENAEIMQATGDMVIPVRAVTRMQVLEDDFFPLKEATKP